jgi:SAM-dependent methyltransferase
VSKREGRQQFEVYGSAVQGARARIASAGARRARERRHRMLLGAVPLDRGTRILDVGCGPLGLRAWEPDWQITGVDIRPRPDYPGPFVQADATAGLPFGDGEFDFAFSNSVIEHVDPAQRAAFAAEIRRVARGWWVQTPAFGFPIEPHSLLPAAHWLPRSLRRPYWRLGVAGDWEEIALLTRRELGTLFGSPVIPERLGPLTKSWIALSPPPITRAGV